MSISIASRGRRNAGHADEHRAAAEGQAVVDVDADSPSSPARGRRRCPAGPAPTTATFSGAGLDVGHDVGDARGLVPLDEEALHRPDRERPVDVAAAAGALARGRADVGAHRRDRVGLAREDVALLEAALGGEVQVAPAVRPDRARLLALDVALEPGGVDRLDEEFLAGRGSSGGRAFPCGSDRRGGTGAQRRSGRIYHRQPTPCTRRRTRRVGPRELTASVVASYPRMRVVRPALPGPRRARDET